MIPEGVPRKEFLAALARSTILSQCSPQDLAKLLPFFRERRLKPGEALCRAGDLADDMWLVLRGTLRVMRADRSSQEVSDGLVGEESALGMGRYLTDIVAADDVTVAAFDKDMTPRVLRNQSPRTQAFGRSLVRLFAPPTDAEPAEAADDDRITPAAAVWRLAGWLTAIAAPLLLLRLFEGGSLRWEQQQLAAVLASAALLWIFGAVAPYVAGLLVIMVCVTLGIAPTTVVLSGFASNGFFLALSILCLGTVLIESGVINRIFLLLMKRCYTSTLRQDFAAMFAGFALTPIVPSRMERARALAPLALESTQTLGFAPGSRDSTRLLISAFMGVTLFAPMFLTGGAMNLMLYGSLPEQVQDATPGLSWMGDALVAALVLVAAYLATHRLLFRRSEASIGARHTIEVQLDVLGPIRATEWLAVGGVVLYAIAVATVSAHKVDHRLLALAVVCGYLVLGILGKHELNLHIDWSTLILLGTLIGLVATVVSVDLHIVIADRLAWLSDTMEFRPRIFIALLAACVMISGLWVPRAGALIGLIVVPLAMVNGMNPWVVIFTILLMSDAWLLPAQSNIYRTFRDMARSIGPFDERLFLTFNAVMTAARIVALAASVVYWESLRIL
jgi:DASS family divalent anion:Na+ symporter